MTTTSETITGTFEIDRRDFRKIEFDSTAVEVTTGNEKVLVPSNDVLPAGVTSILTTDDQGYLIDANFDWADCSLPTRLEKLEDHYNFSSLPKPAQDAVICEDLSLEKITDLSPEEIAKRLDEWVDVDELSPYEAASHGEHALGIDLYEELSREEAQELGVEFVEGECPGSSFCAVFFADDVDALNKKLAEKRSSMRVV